VGESKHGELNSLHRGGTNSKGDETNAHGKTEEGSKEENLRKKNLWVGEKPFRRITTDARHGESEK